MITSRRKIGINLLVAVLATAVLAIPATASATPKKGNTTQTFSESGTIQVPAPQSQYIGGITENFASCSVDENFQGVDGWWIQLPSWAPGAQAQMTSTAIDMDVWFYDSNCRWIGDYVMATPEPNEEGTIPADAAWAIVYLYTGQDADFTFTASKCTPTDVRGAKGKKGGCETAVTYELPISFEWAKTTLDVLIIPPSHGQVVNDNGVLNGEDLSELNPLANSYLEAVEDSIAAWNTGIDAFGPAWLQQLVIKVYVVGRDEIPQETLESPEIVVTSDESKGYVLGTAVSESPPAVGRRCIVDNSKFVEASFTYEDMYNTNGHEYGHCLGVGHSSYGRPEHDLMDGTYDHIAGAVGTHLHCVSNLDVMALEAVFAEAFGEPKPPSPLSILSTEYQTIPCSLENPAGA